MTGEAMELRQLRHALRHSLRQQVIDRQTSCASCAMNHHVCVRGATASLHEMSARARRALAQLAQLAQHITETQARRCLASCAMPCDQPSDGATHGATVFARVFSSAFGVPKGERREA